MHATGTAVRIEITGMPAHSRTHMRSWPADQGNSRPPRTAWNIGCRALVTRDQSGSLGR
jgi:hypothetical protein